MSGSVSPSVDELPDLVELALLMRAVWRMLPMVAWSETAVASKAETATEVTAEQAGNLGAALLAATLLSLHCRAPGTVDVELRQLLGDMNAVKPRNSTQSLLFDVLSRAVRHAAGESNEVPGAREAERLADLVDHDGEAIRVHHAYQSERERIAKAGSALGRLDREGVGSLLDAPLWAEMPQTLPDLQHAQVRWHKTLTAHGWAWLWAIYLDWLQGNPLDWRRLESYVHDWYETRLLDEVGEQGDFIGKVGVEDNHQRKAGGDTGFDPGPVLQVAGGIVTAAADAPCVEDSLGRKPLVDTLADMLASPEQPLPMTIALLGAWGAGKSSVILQLRQRLARFNQRKDRAHFHFAGFNAWEYEHTDNLRAGLAHEVVRGLTADMSWWQKMRLALNNAYRQHAMELYGLLAALLLAGLALWLGLATVKGATGTAAQTGGLGAVGFGAWLVVNAFRNGKKMLAHPLAADLKTYLQLPSYGRHLGEVPVIREEIGGLCAFRLGEQQGSGIEQRLLVVVDDLDRCQPECITACLDAVRLVMSLPYVAVIIAVDDRIAFQAVAAHYADLAKDGSRSKEAIARDYLGKIIQLPIKLYPPWPQEVAAFVRDYLFEVVESPDPASESGSLGGQTTADGAGMAAIHVTDPGQIVIEASVEAGDRPVSSISDADPVVYQPQAADPAAPERARRALSEQQTERDSPRQLRDHPFEQEQFIELAKLAQFSNPRQLIRLRNGYRLLKGYTLNRRGHKGMDWQDCERLLLGLFWYEYLYQREVTERREQELLAWEWFEPLGLDDAAKSRADNRRLRAAESSMAMIQQLAECLGEQDWHKSYPTMLRTVQMAVLPNADLGLLLSKDEAAMAAADEP